jgi:hypothetical protein
MAACLIKFVTRDGETIFAAAEEAWWFLSEVPTCSKNALRTEVKKPQEAEALDAYSRAPVNFGGGLERATRGNPQHFSGLPVSGSPCLTLPAAFAFSL